MAWFRRRSSNPDAVAAGPPAEPCCAVEPAAPATPAPVDERIERAVMVLAAQSSQLREHLHELERRIEDLAVAHASAQAERAGQPSYDDVLEARLHTARVGAEVTRLEVNVAARLDAVRAELRAATRAPDAEVVDLRELQVTDTGWAVRRTG